MKIYNKNVENLKDFLSAVFADDGEETVDALERVFVANGISTIGSLAKYAYYSSANRGCNVDNPFVIEETDEYVSLEYFIVDFLRYVRKESFPLMKLKSQKFFEMGDRNIDVLIFEVYANNEEKLKGNATAEEYFFDITAGFGSN